MPICRALPCCLSLCRAPRSRVMPTRTPIRETLSIPEDKIKSLSASSQLSPCMDRHGQMRANSQWDSRRKSLLIADAIRQHCRRGQSPNMGQKSNPCPIPICQSILISIAASQASVHSLPRLAMYALSSSTALQSRLSKNQTPLATGSRISKRLSKQRAGD